MNLWIRSQDNGLFNPKIIKPPFEDGSVWCYIENTNILLGSYKTKERALEVLDEIHDVIAKNEAFVLYSNIGDMSSMNKEVFTPIYKMPEE